MRVVGIDPGKSVGYAVFDPTARMYVCGAKDLRGCKDVGWLVADFEDWLDNFLDAFPGIALLSIERPFGNAAFTSQDPVILCGVAHAVAHRRGLARREYTASQLKKRIAGNGRATKADVVEAVKLCGFAPESDHAADAAAAAVCAWNERAQEVRRAAIGRSAAA